MPETTETTEPKQAAATKPAAKPKPAAGARVARRNVTIDGETYPAGSKVPAAEAAKVDNPNVWKAPTAGDADGDVATSGDDTDADKTPAE